MMTGTRGATASAALNAVASSGTATVGGSMAQVGNAVRALVAQPAPVKPAKPALAEVGARADFGIRAEPVKADALRSESKWAPAGTASAVPAAASKPAEPDRATIARMKGYQGDSCGECGNFTLVRNGTCLKCDTCGSTTGCS